MCRSLAFSADGHTLASASCDQTVRFWDVATGQVRAVLRHPSQFPVFAFSPDGQLLATWGGARDVELWEVATGQHRTRVQRSAYVPALAIGLANWVLAYDAEGLLLASGASAANSKEAAVERWHTATPQDVLVWKGNLDGINALAFSSDGRLLAAGNWDGTISRYPARLASGEADDRVGSRLWPTPTSSPSQE